MRILCLQLKYYICAVPYINGKDYIYNSNIKYFDNIILYFKTLKGEINNKFVSDNLGLEIFFKYLLLL